MAVQTPAQVQHQVPPPADVLGTVQAPRHFVALGELAQLYSQLTLSNDTNAGDPHAPLDDRNRAVFERKLSVFEKNIVEALRGVSSEQPSWTTQLMRAILGRTPPVPKIKEYYFCSSLPAGIVLLCHPSSRLYLTFPPDAHAPAWISDLLVRAEGLYIEIREILRDPNRGICLELLFTAIVQLIKLMGNEDYRQKHPCLVAAETTATSASDAGSHGTNGVAGPGQATPRAPEPPLHVPPEWHMPPWPDLQRTYEAQFTQGADLVRRMAQRQGQLDYFWGMVGGAFLLALVIAGVQFLPALIPSAGLGWMATQLAVDPTLTPLLWLCPVIGGIGALVSVMQRMGSGTFALRDRAGAGALRRVGAFRPLIGAVFASVIVTILITGMVPVQLHASAEQNRILLYCVVAFFAGFSERWAQDMLGAGEAAISAGTDAERRAAAT